MVPHTLHGPAKNPVCQRNVLRIEMPKANERDDTLSNTMDVHRIVAVVEILDCTTFSEKVCAVELEAASHAGIELRSRGILGNRLQRAKIVPGMEVIYPGLRRRLPVVPGTIGTLRRCRTSGNPERSREELFFTSLLVDPAQ